MKHLFPPFTLLLLGLFAFGCEKDNFLSEERFSDQNITVPLKFEALVAEPDTSYQVGASLAEEESYRQQIMEVRSFTRDEAGPILYLGIGELPANSTSPEWFTLSLKFRLEGIDPTGTPDWSALREYFPEGKEFSFGDEGGEVQLGILLPTTDLFGQRSQSTFLESPEGIVTVTGVETFLVPLPESDGGDKEYLMIDFSFTGSIGIYDQREASAAERDNVPYRASESAQVSGAATLVLAVTPG